MKYVLNILSGEQQGDRIALEEGKFVVIGRNPACDFYLSHPSISREHCRVRLKNRKVIVEDIESVNGVLVNKKKVIKQELSPEDIIDLGPVHLQLLAIPEARLKNKEGEEEDTRVYRCKNQGASAFHGSSFDSSRREIVLLHRIGKLLQRQKKIDETLESVLETILICLNPERGCIVLKSRNADILSAAAHRSWDQDYKFCKRNFSISQEVLKAALEGVGTSISDVNSDAKLPKILCAPIGTHEKTMGAIYLDCLIDKTVFREGDLDLMTAVGEQIGLAVERILQEQKLVVLEEQRAHMQRMETIGELAGGLAHDLNNILGPLVGYPDLLLTQVKSGSPLIQPLQNIQKAAGRAADVVRDLLSLAQRKCYEMTPLDINDSIKKQLKSESCKNLAENYPEVKLKCSFAEDPLLIHGSSNHLDKAFAHLLNTFYEMMSGQGTILISTRKVFLDKKAVNYDGLLEGECAVIKIGGIDKIMSKQDLNRIFEPFYIKRKLGMHGVGFGLGLAAAYGVIKDHGGTIEVESNLDMGTIFTIYFPLKRGNLSRQDKIIPSLQGTENILVVDDVEEQRQIADSILSALGYDVQTVSCGEDAVACIREKNIDLVILDMVLEGGIDGLETYRRIIEIKPEQKAIIVSGYADNDKIEKTRELGVALCLRKPYTVEQLAIATKNGLEKSSDSFADLAVSDPTALVQRT